MSTPALKEDFKGVVVMEDTYTPHGPLSPEIVAEVEKRIIGTVLVAENIPSHWRELAPEKFADDGRGRMWGAILSTSDSDGKLKRFDAEIAAAMALGTDDALAIVQDLADNQFKTDTRGNFARIIESACLERLRKDKQISLRAAAEEGDLALVRERLSEIESMSDETDRAKTLDRYLWKSSNPVPEVYPILELKETPILTEGNLLTISGQAKAGKSHAIAAMIASGLTDSPGTGDFLGFRLHNPEKRAVIYLDFEQAEKDFDTLLRSVLSRAGLSSAPDLLMALHLTSLAPNEGESILRDAMVEAEKRFGGIAVVLIDGVADLIESPNDEAASFDLVRRLHTLAIRHKTGIACVLHTNPTNDSFAKMRGHLGSQIERKSETVLTLKKGTDEVVSAFTAKSRHKPIPETQGARFGWDVEMGRFCSVAAKVEVRNQAKAGERAKLAADIFATTTSMSFTDAATRISELEGIKVDAAKKRLGLLRREGFVMVQPGTGFYDQTERSTHG